MLMSNSGPVYQSDVTGQVSPFWYGIDALTGILLAPVLKLIVGWSSS